MAEANMMNKAELISEIAERVDLTKAGIERVVDNLLDVIREQLEAGNGVKLTGFGKFEVRQRAARTGHNPHTGEAIDIPAKRVAACKLTLKLSQPQEKKAKKRK